jgi:dGTPase
VRDQIGVMVNDVIETSRANIAESGVESVSDVRAAGRALIGFSPEIEAQEQELTRFMYANLYLHESQLAEAQRARAIITGLFSAYRDGPEKMGGVWSNADAMAEPLRSRHIADYIAGMTDRFAERQYEAIYGALPKI